MHTTHMLSLCRHLRRCRMIMGQQSPDGGELRVGDTVVPMYVDQSRDALDPDR